MGGTKALEFSDMRKQGTSETIPKVSRIRRALTWMRIHLNATELPSEFARHSKDPLELFVLAKSRDHCVRESVAENPNTPVFLLVMLAKDPNRYVREAVTCNPNTPIDTLVDLAADEDPDVRLAVAKRSDCPVETVSRIICTYHIEKEHPLVIERFAGICRNDEEEWYDPGESHHDETRPARYEHAHGFEDLVRALRVHNRDRRESIIEGVKRYNKELAEELERKV